MVGIEQIMINLQSGGMKLILPFLLVFVILYGVLRMIDLFNQNEIDASLAVILSVIVIGYTPFVQGVFYGYLTNIFGGVSILLLSLLAFYMLAGFMVPGDDIFSDYMEDHKGKLVTAAAIIIGIMAVNYGLFDFLLGYGFDISFEQLFPYIVLGGMVGFIMYVVGSGEKDGDNTIGRDNDGED